MNKSLRLDTIEVPFSSFNVVRHNATLYKLDHEHVTNWQVEIENKLRYENPNGNAAIRLYDGDNKEKFIEIGMGSPQDYRLWVAINTPEDGYFVIREDKKMGWSPDKVITLTHSNNGGFSATIGSKTVVDNLDVAGFSIKEFSVYGIDSASEPPTVYSGNMTLSFLSGEPSQNPIFYMPAIILAATAFLVIILLKTKKRAVSE